MLSSIAIVRLAGDRRTAPNPNLFELRGCARQHGLGIVPSSLIKLPIPNPAYFQRSSLSVLRIGSADWPRLHR